MNGMKITSWFTILFSLLLQYQQVPAHEVRPAYFQLTQVTDSTYNLLWKVPARGESIPKLYPVLPKSWKAAQIESTLLADNLLRIYEINSDEIINGKSIYFEGLEKTIQDVLVKIELSNGESYTAIIKPDKPFFLIPVSSSTLNVFKTYMLFGVEHIWLGIDHLLFVFALVLITTGAWKMVKTITAFTVAHSITLSLAVLGFVEFPSAPVEAVISLSIMFLALELIRLQQGKQVTTAKYPWIVAFTFGLLHGFGFAGALTEVGLPQLDIPMALASFNIGVELGQLGFVLVSLVILRMIKLIPYQQPVWLKKVPVYMIGSIAAMWTIERVLSFF
jgi:hydrogenase/urease accessory protein HupE